MNEKICCVTGHRDIPEDKLQYVKERLREEVKAAIADGCTTFISGFSRGADLLFAGLVVEQREAHLNLFLEAALAHRGMLLTTDPTFRLLLPPAQA